MPPPRRPCVELQPEIQNRFTLTQDRILTTNSKNRYLVHYSDDDATFDDDSHETVLATVIDVQEHNHPPRITEEWLQSILRKYSKDDDVFCNDFLQMVAFYGLSQEEFDLTSGAEAYLTDLGTQRVVWLDATSFPFQMISGPYAVMDGRFREVWRLYSDTHESFRLTLQPGLQQTFEELRVRGSTHGYYDVAVPSRLRRLPLAHLPLNGLRIAVKDIFHLKGVKTSLCNRAYYDTYSNQEKTADCIQALIDRGAIIIGKTKLSSFGHWEEPMEYINYPAPWNPRADGYQSPGGSSSGSAAAIGAYVKRTFETAGP